MRFILRRLGFYFVALWVALTLNFFLPRLMPGDPAAALFARFRGKLGPEALAAFERETEPAGQRRIAARLQRIFVGEAPAIPLYPNPTWAEFNTRRFTGFPTADDPYADPSPNKMERGEILLVLTSLRPR